VIFRAVARLSDITGRTLLAGADAHGGPRLSFAP
jgi:hypothetical protein